MRLYDISKKTQLARLGQSLELLCSFEVSSNSCQLCFLADVIYICTNSYVCIVSADVHMCTHQFLLLACLIFTYSLDKLLQSHKHVN